ncbi:WD40-repeat-containing domain protein [Lipomyces arxii]|uniref:WD40-repeat-containing domain protein n=1 Tax=Lipomyces arxii TaxID=56418 RepID=UPI0034CD87B3
MRPITIPSFEPPTPAPSPTPSGDSYFTHTFDRLDRLSRDFNSLTSSHRQALLSALLSNADTATLSFVLNYVSPLLKKDPFRVLPNEVCWRILAYVDPNTLSKASQVSKRWAEVVSDDLIWKNLCDRLNYTDTISDTYKSLFKQRHMVESSWTSGGLTTARHVTTDQGVVTCLSSTTKYIIVALDNSRIHVFSSAGELLHTLTGHVMGVWAIMPWDDILVSGGCDRDVRVWDLITGECISVLHGHTSTVRCLKMSDSRTAISGSRDASLRVWDIETGVCINVLLGHQASVRCLEVQGDICVSGSYDTTAKVWSISRGVLLHTLSGHFSQIYALAFDGVRIATGSLDTSVRIWSAESGQCLAILQGHTSLVGQLQMAGNTLVTGSSDGSTRVWDLRTMSCVHRLAAHDNSVTTLQFDSRRIVTGGSDGRVKLWDIRTGHHIRDLPCSYDAVWRVAFKRDKLVILASTNNRTHMELISFAPPP